ncbi:MAG: hypothetical protein OXE93_00075 [bacterium]|nr:hypothetical protein [bacterium]
MSASSRVSVGASFMALAVATRALRCSSGQRPVQFTSLMPSAALAIQFAISSAFTEVMCRSDSCSV